ncbi:MAG TPA: SDR family oxidoreductase [Pirellulales bacterium]|jgi:short-subunit dehydrogenase|nr:SDR family oxidoreductase [Pirellulales bacterium]
MRRSLAGARVLLTGSSSGIGRALALALAKHRCRLLLTARRRELLDALAAKIQAAGAEVVCFSGDITSADVRAGLIERAKQSFGGLDILINNAGVGAIGRFRDARPERLREIFEVNFFALAEMTRAALPQLIAGRRPLVVNIGSILGHRGVPHSSEYCASKFAVQGFSESLRAELARDGIELLVVSPGTTATEFFDHAIESGKTPWPEQRGVPAEHVAAATVAAMQAGRHEIIPNPRGKWLVRLNRLAPGLVDRLMQRWG